MNENNHAEPRRTLSSDETSYYKYVQPFLLPGISFMVLGLLSASHRSFTLFLFTPWGVAILLYIWTREVRHVRLGRDRFYIRDGKREIEVPIDHLKDFQEGLGGKPKLVTLLFEPPTPWGTRIVFIAPPRAWQALIFPAPFSRNKQQQVLAQLSEIVTRNAVRFAPKARPTPAAVRNVLEEFATDESSLQKLSETDLDHLIEALPHDAPVRDRARQERVRRWYG